MTHKFSPDDLFFTLYTPFPFWESHGDADEGYGENQLDAQGLEDICTDISRDVAKLDKHVIGCLVPVNGKKLGDGLDTGVHIFQRYEDTAEETHSQGYDIDNAG